MSFAARGAAGLRQSLAPRLAALRISSMSPQTSGQARAAAGAAAEDSMIPSLVVFGGNGYVGSHVCQEALAQGIPVTSVSRSGKPGNNTNSWVDEVNWVSGDALQPESYIDQLKSCLAVISCIGLISTSQDSMRKMNGDANVSIINAAAEAGVARMAYISAHDYNFPGDLGVARGYFEGKRAAEAALSSKMPENGVALRPGFIHGTRRWGSTQVPLYLIGSPLETVLSVFPTQSLAKIPVAGAAFVPPVSAAAVAKAAVAAATDSSIPAGPMSVWDIAKYK